MFVDALQAEMHKKYDLGPRQKAANHDNQPHPKNPIPSIFKDKVKEITNIPKDIHVREPSNIEKKVKELEESIQPFNIEKELSKINILAPLVELVKKPSYNKHIEKFIQGKGSTIPPNTVNL
jgi:hypothetical protein